MSHALQSENESLRQQLEALLHEARRNEDKMRRFDQFERRLIGMRSLAALIKLLLTDYRTVFELDAVSLLLIDPEYEISRLLEDQRNQCPAFTDLLLHESGADLENLYQGCLTPLLCVCDARPHGFLFGSDTALPASIALLPLVCQGRLIGSLNLGSYAVERFSSDSGTEFLGRLAAIAAVCLENALNHERLQLVGLTDPLTGVNNRRYFESRLQEEAVRAQRHALPLSCMFIDIDKFKGINDTFGHRVGDEVLREVAGIIKAQLRGSDVIARYGGEEFVALLPQTGIEHTCDIAERIRAAIAAHGLQTSRGEELRATVSIGLSMLPDRSDKTSCEALAGQMIERADKALYEAKQGGRNRVVNGISRPPRAPLLPPFLRHRALGAVPR